MNSETTSVFARQDTSICEHLKTLILPSDQSSLNVQVKIEQMDEVVAESSSSQSQVNHVGGSRRAEVDKRFVDIVRWGARDEGIKRRKVSAPECHSCRSPLSRPWACLTCSFVGCMSPYASGSSTKKCFQNHWRGSQDKCSFAVDPATGAIFCAGCDDTIYPDSFETLFRLAKTRVEESNDSSREQSILGKGRERGPYKPWTPSTDLIHLDIRRSSCRGLRPLLNLSQTCFLSAVLQALIHNPLLKAYFLSDKHNRHVCANGSKGLSIGKPYIGPQGIVSEDRDKGCMCCEMDRAFEEFYNEDKSPYGPITMLYSMWHASAELEGYGQQDAHSFFLAALDQIHAHAKGQLSSCNCIAHQTFAGSLLSTVTCSRCKTTSTTVDPILDLQLDFPTDPSDTTALTLTNMLQRFCAEEKVGDAAKGYDCSKCGGGSGSIALRKLQIKKLPPVLSFQLKRFAHNATSTKVELPVKFPSHLDIKPYVEPPVTGSRPLPSSLFEYDLFAVVTHEGKLDNGHYWADVLSGDQWWHCDDDKVTPTSLKEVLAQKAYMLFYVKRSLAYAQPMTKPLNTSNGTSNAAVSTAFATPTTTDVPLPDKIQNPYSGRGGHAISGMAV
ncbi:ubiquitin specific protease [Papiliotrema laurentii]|uniref:Ubiquitin specific protease n=1 Tax=Papiliotrema laurentii TaxID=5418 RepID=A0AAD9CXV6_PAPLA|nr:ubiquitin specific protease [Papiliotrema laurentii]